MIINKPRTTYEKKK